MGGQRLSNSLRKKLKKPLGDLVPTSEVSIGYLRKRLAGTNMVVAVGDATTATLVKSGVRLDIHVVDDKEKRKPANYPQVKYRTEYDVVNPPGTLTEESLAAVTSAAKAKGPVQILVEGEEDLLTLLFMATYPNGTRILYGQPDEGIVVIELDDRGRKLAQAIMKEMMVDLG